MNLERKSIIETHSLARVDEEPATGGRAELMVIAADSSWRFLLPRDGTVLVGRSSEADLSIQQSSISRRHAKLVLSGGDVQIVDLRSHNGIRVNGERVDDARSLVSGDVVTVGEATLVLRCEQPGEHRDILDLRRLRQQLAAEIRRALDCGRALSVLLLSHGDAPRARVAPAVASELRPMDAVGWCSSTHLAILLPEIDARGARGLGAELCAILGSSAPELKGGVARLRDDGCDADTLLSAARAAAELAAPGQIVVASDAVVRHRLGDREVLLADPAMIRLYDLLRRLARSDVPVLVLGETGTGKENAAAAVHEFSPRAGGPLVAVNCAAIPETLIESELFGHEKGAFSGATAAKPGLLERASGGTLFFDEIGELPLGAQAKLLRALETRRVTRLGDVREREVDLRIVAATNRDLEAESKAGRFREDLLFRLSVATVRLVPLRQRPREIPILAREFLARACSRLDRAPASLTHAALERLAAYDWPGNVRELKNAMEYAAAVMTGDAVETWDLPAAVAGRAAEDGQDQGAAADSAPPERDRAPAPERRFRKLAEEIRELEITRMTEALQATGGVQTRAAELIGMPVRTFVFKARQFGLRAKDTR